MQYEASAQDIIILVDSINSSIKVGAIDETLIFNESLVCSTKVLSISDMLTFHDVSTSRVSIKYVTLSDTVIFTDQTAPRVFFMTVNDFLFMFDALGRPKHGGISETITIVDSATIDSISKYCPEQLTFADIMNFRIHGDKVIPESVQLSDNVSAFKVHSGTRTPQILFQTLYDITFVAQDLSEFTLHGPKFGDSETVTYKRINRDLRGGESVIRSYNTWNPTKLFKVEFDYLSESKVNGFREFMRRNVGLPVQCVDHNGKIRNLIFQNPSTEFSQIGRSNRTFILDSYEL